jgi:phosphoglycolate phosphatase-like HAD superfamily hydrolase
MTYRTLVFDFDGTIADTLGETRRIFNQIAPDYGISVAGVYQVADGKIVEVKGSGGVSPRDASDSIRKLEAQHGVAWYNAIARDTWGSGV